MPKPTALESLFGLQLKAYKLEGFQAEYFFHPVRKFRFDYANEALRIAVELEGGIWTGGRHTRGAGFEEDCRKYVEAVILGWTLLRFTTNMVKSGEAILALQKVVVIKHGVGNRLGE